MPLEHEAKFILTDVEKIRSKILNLKGHSKGRFFETNVRYENKDNDLRKNKILLRLRQDQQVRLTFKSPVAHSNSGVKTMNEIEVSVSDFDSMDQILKSVGFHRAQIYEKWRETIVLKNAELCLDTMPFGEFLEIEGTPDSVRDISAKLGLLWQSRVLDNYLTIFERLKKWEALSFNDVSFNNFKDVKIDLNRYVARLEAGE